MTTAITADDLLAAFKKRGVPFRFYKDRADFLTHNRNAAPANARVTAGGFGPLKGVIGHNFGSSGKDIDQLAYLYRGDGPTSGKPGPLCLGGIVDDGTVVLMGWGAATHAGPADPKTIALLEANAMPTDTERRPVTMGTDPGTLPVNPFFLGFEMCHGSEGPTPAQRRTLVRATAAIMEMLGPFADYSGGSFAMHRELTYNRSDAQGIARDGSIRREVNALLRSWAAPAPAPAPVTPPAQKATEVVVTLSAKRITANQRVTVTATVTPAVPGIVRFEWTRPGDAKGWMQFGGDIAVKSGKATVLSTPGDDIVYHAKFYPTDTKAHAGDWSPNVPLDVVTLAEVVALEQQLDSARATIEALKAGTPSPEAPTVERLQR
jgi:hypothetical protein